MTKITRATAETLIRLYNDIYANDREEWFHVRTTDNHILMEVNMYRSFVRVYVDYATNCYAFIDRVQDFDLLDVEDKVYLRIKTGSPMCPFIVEVERNYLYPLNVGGNRQLRRYDDVRYEG